ncbi:MAG: MBL fold metallo-hydrolase [Ilumatobacteraceae bacterium]
MSVAVPGHRPILFDLGTGARYFGVAWPVDEPFNGTCLLSHLHWDHVQGLPFFTPLLRPGCGLDLHGPVQDDGAPLGEVFDRMLCPPLFPVGVDDLPGEVRFHDHGDDEFSIGDVAVMSRLIPHLGPTLGYRLSWGGVSIAYLSDHQQPGVDVYEITDNVRELCDGVDLLIHDAQYTRAEFEQKASWGHCTTEFALFVAEECGAASLALYHHDPQHHDDLIDDIVATTNRRSGRGVHVFGAREGQTVRLAR